MKLWSRHISPGGTAGLASICVATAVISWIGHRSTARLMAEQEQNADRISSLSQQIEIIDQSLLHQQSITLRNSSLAASVNRPPLSKVLAEISEKLPADCCAELITTSAQPADCASNVFTIRARCADVTKFAAQHANGPTRNNFRSAQIFVRTIGDPAGLGFGWSRDLSATVVFKTEIPSDNALASVNEVK